MEVNQDDAARPNVAHLAMATYKNASPRTPKVPIIKKMDIGEDEKKKLANVIQCYAKMNGYSITVRPWIEEDYARKPSINLFTQFALYKCMHEHCIFATDDEEKWNKHMDKHINVINVFASMMKVQNETLVRQTRKELVKFRGCPYCNEEFNSNHSHHEHMEEVHRRSIFQCAYCFYRTIEMDNIVLHYEKYHTNERFEVLMYGEIREYGQGDEESHRALCNQNVHKIRCAQGKDYLGVFFYSIVYYFLKNRIFH